MGAQYQANEIAQSGDGGRWTRLTAGGEIERRCELACERIEVQARVEPSGTLRLMRYVIAIGPAAAATR